MIHSAQAEKTKAAGATTIKCDPLTPTVFHQPWWLNAATKGTYDQVEVSDGHRVVGRFPFMVKDLPGRRLSGLPTLTHILGPAIYEGEGTPNTRFLQRYTVTKDLIAKLPKLDRFRQKLHRGYPEVLSFQSAGFRTGVQFTFEIEPLDEADTWNRLRNKTRNVIRRANENLELVEIKDPGEFLSFYNSNLASRGLEALAPADEHMAVCTAALEKRAGAILLARDRLKNPVAAIFLVFDANRAYYLMSTRTVESKNGAISLLIWNALRFCRERNLIFDFDGIVTEGAILLYVGFGGSPKPTYIVTRDSKRIKLVDSSRGLLGLQGEENLFDRS